MSVVHSGLALVFLPRTQRKTPTRSAPHPSLFGIRSPPDLSAHRGGSEGERRWAGPPERPLRLRSLKSTHNNLYNLPAHLSLPTPPPFPFHCPSLRRRCPPWAAADSGPGGGAAADAKEQMMTALDRRHRHAQPLRLQKRPPAEIWPASERNSVARRPLSPPPRPGLTFRCRLI